MALPVISQIAAAIAARLARVTTANGFHQTITVRRPPGKGISSVDNFETIIAQDASVKRIDDGSGNDRGVSITRWEVTYYICTFIKQSDDDPRPLDDVANAVLFDSIAAVSTAPAGSGQNWQSFGGLALGAKWGELTVEPTDHAEMVEAVAQLTINFVVADRDGTTPTG